MGTYQGQATLVLGDQTKIEGQASIRTSKRLWEGTIVVGEEDQDRAHTAARIELPTGESRAVAATGAEPDATTGAAVVSFASTDG
ncbi:hypothetical protein [Actinophytocola sediminis]